MSDTVKFTEPKTNVDLELYKKLQKQMEEDAVGILSTRFQSVLTDFPEIDRITWNQYAPYFNDGDPCVFNVNDICFKLKQDETAVKDEEDEDEYEDEDYGWPESDIEDSKSPIGKAEKELNEFASAFENIFEEAFGSDSLVICTREGFEIREFQHD